MKYRLRPPVENEIEAARFRGRSTTFSAWPTWCDGPMYQQHSMSYVMPARQPAVYVSDYMVQSDAKGSYGVMTEERLNARFEA